ncbi:SPOSA6832_03202 [Sporobolomyces salmonicolor]|uniref:SPOSA6832_03202-mRNA-1:cds n=1 Tax=Sporidiobolus salmonicolor TaxID=5005 RepID=A0A0D6EN45_SPOSA|nr:SPOSA6832_03202 [Sporobolomyces salmonicolor]
MPAPLASELPPELFLAIFSHLEFDGGYPDQDTLRSASLVCRAWRDPAQTTLWESGALLENEQEVRSWIRTKGRRRCGPREMVVANVRGEGLLQELFGEMHGVQALTILNPEGNVSANTFAHPALFDLKELTLHVHLTATSPVSPLPFHLRRLVLLDSTLQTRHLASFLNYIAPSSSSSMRFLSLSSIGSTAHPPIGSSDQADPYIPILHSATSLDSLECTSMPLPILRNLPPSLTGMATQEDAGKLDVGELREAFAKLKRLERLYFACARRDFARIGGLGLVEELERRTIKLYFAADEEQ